MGSCDGPIVRINGRVGWSCAENAGQLDWAHKTQVDLLRQVRENDFNEHRIQLMQSMNCISAGLGWTG